MFCAWSAALLEPFSAFGGVLVGLLEVVCCFLELRLVGLVVVDVFKPQVVDF